VHNSLTAGLGIWLISTAVMNWMNGRLPLWARAVLFAAALLLIDGGWLTDLVGVGVLTAFALWRYRLTPAAGPVGGTDPMGRSADSAGCGVDGATGSQARLDVVPGAAGPAEGAHGADGGRARAVRGRRGPDARRRGPDAGRRGRHGGGRNL